MCGASQQIYDSTHDPSDPLEPASSKKREVVSTLFSCSPRGADKPAHDASSAQSAASFRNDNEFAPIEVSDAERRGGSVSSLVLVLVLSEVEIEDGNFAMELQTTGNASKNMRSEAQRMHDADREITLEHIDKQCQSSNHKSTHTRRADDDQRMYI